MNAFFVCKRKNREEVRRMPEKGIVTADEERAVTEEKTKSCGFKAFLPCCGLVSLFPSINLTTVEKKNCNNLSLCYQLQEASFKYYAFKTLD